MGYRPSPRPSFDAPTAIRAATPCGHVGRRGGRLRRGLDLRLVTADPRHRVRPPARRRVPPLGELSDGVRRRRAAARAAGDARARQPGDGRGRPRGARRERLLPPRHLASRLLLRRRAPAGARALRAAARRPAPPARTRGRGRTSRRASTPSTASWEPSPTPSDAGARSASFAERTRLAARPRRARRAARQHRAPDGRHRDRGRRAHEPGGGPRRGGARLCHPRGAAGRGGGVQATLAPGDAFFVPSATAHRYAATGEGVAEAVFGVAPSFAAPRRNGASTIS